MSVATLAAVAVLTAIAPAQAASTRPFVVVASGLENPRGLKFGPDGHLYVAEGGLGGTQTTTPQECQQVPQVGPYSGGFTSRISCINVVTGERSTVVDGLPSSQTSPASGAFVSGVADVAFLDRQLYAVEAGAGCSHGLLGTSNELLRVNRNHTVSRSPIPQPTCGSIRGRTPPPPTWNRTEPGTAWSNWMGSCTRPNRTTS